MEGAAGTRKLAAGTMLDDKYRIERLIAVGGMGAVYEGSHIKLRKRVAIKVLNPQLSSAPMIERFHREAITASQIGHEGIAQVTDIGTSAEGEPFLVMEYLEGEPLAARLRSSGPMPIEMACELSCSILSPLAAAHRAGIVHRDLKPDNVYLVRQSRGEMVKLLDFGISRAQGLESEFRLTTTGLVLGTPYYMSPEQARGEHQITPAADLYAIGVILYEMLVGNVPIQAENYNQLMYRVMTGDYARPRERRPDLPEMLEQIIMQAMALEPVQRPISASDLEAALMMFCSPAFRDRLSGRMSAPSLPFAGSGSGTFGPSAMGRSGMSGSGIAGGHATFSAQATVPGTGTGPGYAMGNQVTTPGMMMPGTQAMPARKRSIVPWLAAGLVVVGAAVVAVVAFGGDGEIKPPPVKPGVTTPTQPTQPTQPQPQPTPTPAPTQPVATQPTPTPTPTPTTGSDTTSAPQPPSPAAMVTLRFTVDAPAATITVDGKKLDGHDLTVAKDDASHTLHITAPGRLPHDETLRFDESQRLSIQLPHAAGPANPTPSPTPKTHGNHDEVITDSPYN